MKLENQVAIVTGAGRNIGEQIAHLLASEGARIAVVDLDQDRGAAVAADISSAGGEAQAFVADVSKSGDVKNLVSGVVERFGRVDILVNNVAISDNRDILEITEEEWDHTIAVTLKSPFLMTKFVATQMVEQGDGGKIVNIGSTSGHRGRARAVAYASAKGGVANFTRSSAFQLAKYGIRVNTVSPNKTGSPVGQADVDPNRPITNLADRPGDPIDTARAVLFLVSDEASFIWGQDLFVDGGVTAMEVG
jgi:NAD(P)-dependent dehydrogenase (short-subunit alcohol dehydrogenase family)